MFMLNCLSSLQLLKYAFSRMSINILRWCENSYTAVILWKLRGFTLYLLLKDRFYDKPYLLFWCLLLFHYSSVMLVWKGENCLTELSVLQGLKNPLLSCYFIKCLLQLRFVGFRFLNKHKYPT